MLASIILESIFGTHPELAVWSNRDSETGEVVVLVAVKRAELLF